MTEQIQNQNWVRKALTVEIRYVIGIVVFCVGVVAPYYQIRQEIAIIRENHMLHIEQMQKDITENNEKILKLQETQVDLMVEISKRLQTISN